MKGWLRYRFTRVLALVGIIGLVLVDLGQALPVLDNGFFKVDSQKAFHVGLWISWAAFLVIVVRE